jgi:hypothetical protein
MVENPILQFEHKRNLAMARKHSRYQIRKWAYAALIFLTLCSLGALILFPNVPLVAAHQVSFIAVLLLIGQTIISLGLLLRTLVRATLTAGRERISASNWEAFVLTGVDARTVILGKWKAVIRSCWREYLLLGILRVVIFPVALILHEMHSDHPYLAIGQYSLSNFIPSLPNLMFGISSILLLTLAQLPLIAAIGVLAASRRAHAPTGFGRAFSTWLFMMLGVALLIAFTFIAYNRYVFLATNVASRPFYSWLAVEPRLLELTVLSAIAVADSGVLSPIAVISSVFYSETTYGIGITSLMLTITLYGVLTWIALHLSIRLSQWQGMVKLHSR